MTQPSTPPDAPSQAVVTTTPIDPAAPSTTSLVTTQPLPTALRIVMVLVAGAVAITAGLIAVFAEGVAPGAWGGMLGFATLVFSASNTTLGTAFLMALRGVADALRKRDPPPPPSPPTTAGDILRAKAALDDANQRRTALRSALAWAALMLGGLALCGVLASASGCGSNIALERPAVVDWDPGPPCHITITERRAKTPAVDLTAPGSCPVDCQDVCPPAPTETPVEGRPET